MLWTPETIKLLLDLYLEHRLLWDPKHSKHNWKTEREKAMQRIVDRLGVPILTTEDISRKYRSMRAAYRVEMRNIKTANLRGFFYKPSLYWFPIFKQFMKEIDNRIEDSEAINKLQQEGVLLQEDLRHTVQIQNSVSPEEEYSEEDESSECSDDEFQSFADHIAEQLRSMSVHRAVMIQNQIQRLFANDKEMHDEYDQVEEHEEMI